MDKITKHASKMEKQMATWGAKLDDLVAAADKAGSNAKTDYRAQLDDLKLKHYAVKLKLDALMDAGGDKWDVFKEDIEGAWDVFKGAFHNLKKTD